MSALSASTTGRRKRTVLRKRTLEDTLLNEEERAAIESIDASLTPEDNDPFRYRVSQCCRTVCCNKATFTLGIMVTILMVGGILFGVNFDNKNEVRMKLKTAGGFLISAGVFGILGGVVNLLALLMLFYEIPFIYGTGVIQRQHRQIGNIICRIVIQMLFDSEHLKNYVLERISKYSIDVNIIESISKGLNSRKAGLIVDKHLDDLYSQPESQYLILLGISRSLLAPMIRPAILSLCAETAPFVLTHETEDHTVNIPKLRDAISGFLIHRVHALSKTMISTLMRQLLFRHLIGLIMYGCIMGCMVGLLAQAFRFGLSPELGR